MCDSWCLFTFPSSSQGFEDCLVFDELMDQFHNDLGE